MRRRTKPLACAFVFAWRVVCADAAEPTPNVPATQSVEQLLREVQAIHQRESEADAERQQRFAADRDHQQALVEAAKAALASEQARGDRLRQDFAAQREALTKARDALTESAGDIDELRGVVRTAAGTLAASLHTSLVSAQMPEREKAVAAIAANKRMPTAEGLESIWRILLGEAVASGKIERFEAAVLDADGHEHQKKVTRVGGFNLMTAGEFLRYLPETSRMLLSPHQPDSRLTSLAANLESANGELATFPIDPTRGSLLAMLSQRPTAAERLAQAGIVGYLILALGALALGVAGERFARLLATRGKVRDQQFAEGVRQNNPLGRLRAAAKAFPDAGSEALALKLDEIILAELPPLRRRLPLLAVLATAAPLMGLLGTVAGMIQTFQAMSLFGAGDPRVVSGGISLALMATELGLVVAIPVLLVHAGLHSMSTAIIHALEHEAASLVAEREDVHSAWTARHG